MSYTDNLITKYCILFLTLIFMLTMSGGSVNAESSHSSNKVDIITKESAAVFPMSQDLASHLQLRFNQYWDFLIKHDFKAAYQLETPSYRAQIDEPTYIKSFAATLIWKSATLKKVKLIREDKALIDFELAFSYEAPWGGQVIESTNPYSEEWYYEKGEWWHNKNVALGAKN
ncbi:hypothetical protein [Thiolinea disciformis]|uniref:hypothetical protein n=1 Tax=Thiolinea disciformis TaxID=125614 RepID=UPI00036125EF|nr:hypothetical protein [Thiolinea disciformis]